MRLYKLTDENGQTYNNTQWGEGVTHTASGKGKLCGPGWLHAYTDPLLAVLLNPIHANFSNPRLWEAEGEVGATDFGLKVGTTRLTTIREIPLPDVTSNQISRFAILCARRVCRDEAWNRWADKWLSGEDRSAAAAGRAAWPAARSPAAAAWSAGEAAELSEVEAAREAAEAAREARFACGEICLVEIARQAIEDEQKHEAARLV